jgi:ribonuclease BN (tRNA processing enzyme)
MRLTVVGCSGSFPGPDSASSCYLVEAEHDGGVFRVVLDMGSGSLGALQRYVALESVDAVLLSHLHPDHCLDMCAFYVVRRYHPDGPMDRLPVYGPDGAGERIARAYDLKPGAHMLDEFDFRAFPTEPFEVGPFAVSVSEVDHPVTAFAVKLSDPSGTLVYTGDTARCRSVESFAAGADLLLAEASFLESGDNPPHLHMTGGEAAEVAENAAVGRLVLTHIPPWHSAEVVLAEASPRFSGETLLATPGATFDI